MEAGYLWGIKEASRSFEVPMSAETPDAILQETKRRMHASVEALKKEMATIRTGRANASLLDNVHVDYYGSVVPLNQLATISVPEAGLLVVQPFDKSAIKAVETAILKSDLGINPGNDGNVIRLPIPMLTEERRRDLVKVLHRLGEEIKTGVRNIRRDANEDVKKLEKAKEAHISEDTAKKALEDIQKLTDAHVKEIDEAMKHKEAEILKV
jgi:ribosome recycling factor